MYHYQVENMSCGHCVKAITRAVNALDERAVVQVDLAAGSVEVESTSDAEAVRLAIFEAGYPARLA